MCDDNAAMIIRASKYMPRLYAYITHLDLWLSWVHNNPLFIKIKLIFRSKKRFSKIHK